MNEPQVAFPIKQIPFSTFGSWLSISPTATMKQNSRKQVNTLFLRSHHGSRPGVVKAFLQLTPQNKGIMKIHSSPEVLTWTDTKGGCIDICFATPQCLRLRGRGLGLTLTPRFETVLFELPEQQLVLNMFETSRRYVLETLQGKLTWQGAWKAELEEDVVVNISPDATGAWELALHETQSTFIPEGTFRPEALHPFETCRDEVKKGFGNWHAKTLEVPEDYEETRARAAYLNWASVVNPEGLLKRPAMLMSKNWMSSVWSWDHCFNALATATTDPELAWQQLLLITDYQDGHGCYPDSLNDLEVIYNFTKPPIHGWAVRELLKVSQPSHDVLLTMYDSLARWTTWWLEHRRLKTQALPYYLHGNDSGWDNSSMFDKGVPLLAPDLAAFLVIQLEVLAELAERFGKEANHWKEIAEALFNALLAHLWTEERFVAKHALSHETVANSSLQYCLPILLGQRLPQPMQQALCKSVTTFLTPYGLATEQPSSPDYQANGYWRGPIWAPSTYLIVSGLEACGYADLAHDISTRFCNTCKASGFAENFDALTGEGLRDKAYTWTSSVFLLLANKLLTDRFLVTASQ